MSIVPKDQIQDEPSYDSVHPKKQRRKDPLIGRTINGRFTILDVIARGGMGKVYKAEQAPLGRLCAVKVLNPKYDGDEDPEFQKRFFLEASTAAKLSHANTVTIFDYGRDGDIYYIAMELIRGRTLYRVLREDGPLTEDRVAHVLRQVGRSLREAHALGVIHRDMKPANVVLLRSDGDEADTVKVLDFGLVKHVDKNDAEDLTQQGLFMGSPKYMAPEQILGNPVSPRTDIYSLGVVAYELLTGSVPFDRGASVKTLMAHVNEPPEPMHKVNANVAITPSMHRIVMRCLEKDPADRFESIDELLRELTQVEGGGALTDSLLSAPAVRPPPSTSGAHRRPSVPSLAAEAAPSSPEAADGSGARTRPISLRSPSRSDDSETGEASLRSQHPSATPLPMAQSDFDDADMMPRSNTAIHIGLAAVAVAAIGGLAFAMSSTGSETPEAPAAATTAVATTSVATTATAAPITTAAPAVRTVRLTSKPSGAEVRENDAVVCGATPCDVTWRDAEAGREHTLRFIKLGFVTADQTVARDATSHNAELERMAPARTPAPPPSPAPPTALPKTEPKGKGLSGYKDSPY